MRLSLFKKIILITCLPLACQVAFVFVLGRMLDEAERETEQQSRIRTIVANTDELERDLRDLSKPYTTHQKRDKSADDDTIRGMGLIANDLIRLAQTSTEKENAARILDSVKVIKEIYPLISNGIDKPNSAAHGQVFEFKSTMGNPKLGFIDSAKEASGIDQQFAYALNALKKVSAEMKFDALQTPNREQEYRKKARDVVNFALVANSVLAFILITFMGRSAHGRLSVLMDNTRRLGEGKPLNAMLPGADEIATLDHAIHRMNLALEEAAKRERAIVENAVDVIFALDADSRFTKVSPASEAVWGYSPEELLGRYAIEIANRSDVAKMTEELKRFVRDKGSGQFESRVLRKDGREVYMLWTAQWSESDRSLFCVAHDITERKLAEDLLRESEARTRFIIESMPVGLLVLSKDGYVEHANPTMESIWGYEYNELIGKHVSELLVTEPIEDLSAFTKEFYERTIGHIFEKEARRKNGKTFPAHISLTEFETREGTRLLGILMDVTERHEIERFKREFIGVVSHELRTPLTSIRGSLKLMLTGALGSLTDQANKAITIAERSAGRLINLVNDILDMEKLESGKLEMVLEDTPVAPVLERSLESVRSFADQNNVTIDLEPTDLVAHADGDRVVQVLVNLMSNAVKYSPKGGTVTVATVDKGSEVELRVIDRGRGIPPTHIDQVFEKFKQVDKTDATQKGGTGLGLTICKLIVEQHGGAIGVESELGQGSTFWFRLPKSVVQKQGPELAPSNSSETVIRG